VGTGTPGRKRHANPKKGGSRAVTLRDRGEVGKGAGVSARGERRLEPRSWGQRLRNYRCSSPLLPSWLPQERGRTRRRSFNDFFCLSFVISLVFYIFSGKAWAEGKGELATCRHRADSGREKRHSLGRLNASTIKQKKNLISKCDLYLETKIQALLETDSPLLSGQYSIDGSHCIFCCLLSSSQSSSACPRSQFWTLLPRTLATYRIGAAKAGAGLGGVSHYCQNGCQALPHGAKVSELGPLLQKQRIYVPEHQIGYYRRLFPASAI